jgi:RecB family endonuclease NucS
MRQPRATTAQSDRFECEGDLQLFLLNNLYILEPGLRLYGRASLEGFEFPCAGKRLDILAEDRYSGLLAIEVKLNEARAEALGQLLGYIASIRRMKRFEGRYLRGLLVCRKANETLVNAAQDLAFVSVYEYTDEPKIVRVLDAQDAVHIACQKSRDPGPPTRDA